MGEGKQDEMEYYKKIREYVGKEPLLLPGAVVVIVNDRNEILLQQRPESLWGLPGGLMDLGESMEEVAKREVREETGLVVENLSFVQLFSGKEFFVRTKNGDQFYAITAVYMTNDYSGELTTNSEETLSAQFFPIEQLPSGLIENYQKYIEPVKQLLKQP